MMIESPEGPNWSYETREFSFTDQQRLLNLLWTGGFGPQREPPEATDAEVREAIESVEQDDPTEATDEEIAAIFQDESPAGRTASPPAALEEER